MTATFAGFAPSNIAAYFGVSPIAAEGIISLGNGSTIAALPANERTALQALNPNRFKPGATGPTQGFGDIPWGLDHLAQHPLGSHYHGDFNVVDLVANVATGGLYGVGKVAVNVVETGKVLPNLATVQALILPGGSALQPTVGTKNTLLIEAGVASIGLPTAFPFIGNVLAATGGIGAALLAKAKGVVTNLITGVSDTGAPTGDQRGASPGAPIYPSSGNPTYFVNNPSTPEPGGSTLIMGNGTPGGAPAPSNPNPLALAPAVLPLLALGAVTLFFLIRRLRHAGS
jgi:hypothetical protein